MLKSTLSQSHLDRVFVSRQRAVNLFSHPVTVTSTRSSRLTALCVGDNAMQKIGKFNLMKHKFDVMKRENIKELLCSGIYAIVNITNNHCYIGQSKSIKERWDSHKYSLKHSRHKNLYLQNAWSFYGESSFKFTILEKCGYEALDDKEQYWIERINPEYNIQRNVYEWSVCKGEKDKIPDGYVKPGESFQRPAWHLWVYGGRRHDQEVKNFNRKTQQERF